MTPVEAILKKNEIVWRNLYPDFGKTLTLKFSVGDNVRITKITNVFEKCLHLAGLKRCLKLQNIF